MKFSSSRILPGHDQLTKTRMVSDGIFLICLFIFAVYFCVKCLARMGMSSG